MRLSELKLPTSLLVQFEQDAEFVRITHDSRHVGAGDLYVAIPGRTHDGSAFAASAIERGAAAIALEANVPAPIVPPHVSLVRVADARRFLAHAAERFFGAPTSELCTIGVTGTNGKTTTTWLLSQALTVLGKACARMGTIENQFPGTREVAAYTTPEGDAISSFAARAKQAGSEFLCLEVSSHALAQGRSDGVHFTLGAFTNLSQDHLDFHHTLEDYFAAKARLLLSYKPRRSVVCVDGEYGARLFRLAAEAGMHPHAVSTQNLRTADTFVSEFHMGRNGISANIVCKGGSFRLQSPLFGRHNLENLLVAWASLVELGFPRHEALAALAEAAGPPGRLTRVANDSGVEVLVDYAHTPDALANALRSAREITPGKLIVVFGCGGDRDADKRPKMGAVARENADVVFLTSDNPRSEAPDSILDQVAVGLGAIAFMRNVDRRQSIVNAIALAEEGDTVLIAGKGHETYQIIGTQILPFDDHEVAKDALRLRNLKTPAT